MNITPHLFESFLRCPTKCWLRSASEAPSGNAYAAWVETQNESYRADAAKRLMTGVPANECAVAPPTSNLRSAKWRLALDIVAQAASPAGSGSVPLPEVTLEGRQLQAADTMPATPPDSVFRTPQSTIESRLHAVERVPSEGRGKAAQFIPIRFAFRNKLTKDDKLLLAFDAFALSEALGREIRLGKIIHGDDHATLKVKTSSLVGEVRKRLEKIGALLSNPAPPDLVLNRHCAECEFRDRCWKIALEKDDLSLLAGMSAKERQKLHSKGIFTVTQLSYTFRPRRRPKRLRDKREKYHHSLKALAIREKKIHIVGSPELKIDGTPVYLDVEGLPDRDFYYLIGLRIGHGDSAVQHSLWADTVVDQGKIWREFLAILETVEKPVLIHYGSYEKTFFTRMRDRYGCLPVGSPSARAIDSAINILSFIFAQIYFPVWLNSLKEISALLGARWRSPGAVGIHTVEWRGRWEATHTPELKAKLLEYNQDDCTALSLLKTEIETLRLEARIRTNVDFADSLKREATERAAEIHRTLEGLLESAHFEYAKKRIKLCHENADHQPRSQRQGRNRPIGSRKLPRGNGRLILMPRKRICPKHPKQRLAASENCVERKLIDLEFNQSGCRKFVTRYVGKKAFCPICLEEYSPPAVRRLHQQVFGQSFQAWIIYLRVVLRLSHRLISKTMGDLFHEEVSPPVIVKTVARTGVAYCRTEKLLWQRILKNSFIHIDETKISILGVPEFVWVLTDGSHVMFRLTPSRETHFLHGLLAGYGGTIVSDFYGGYDALPCLQQKCLVHLIRDLNDDLWKNPFDKEYE